MKKRRILAALTVCAMLMGTATMPSTSEMVSLTASAEETGEYTEGTYELLTYRNYGDYIEITGCDESAMEVVIPAEIDGVAVTSIGNSAFNWNSSLTSVTIPDSVISIEAGAFSECTSLTSITIPDSVTSIGASAFSGCTSLTNITIPDSVTSIGSRAFQSCQSLTSITIPDTVTSIGEYAFTGTPWLDEQMTENQFVIVNGILIGTGVCTGDIVIPDGVTSIPDNMFNFNRDITSVVIPDGVTDIGTFAFLYCYSLASVTIPDSVRNIGDGAFFGCPLTSVTIPDGVITIGEAAFCECAPLTSVTIPGSVTIIEKDVFCWCDSLTSVTILNPDCIIEGDSETFSNKGSATITICGYENSTAQTFAETYGYRFKSLGTAPIPEISLGDLNSDGAIDANDASMLLVAAAAAGSGADSGLTAEQIAAADLNADGQFDASDASLILMYAAYAGAGGELDLAGFLAQL